MPITAAADDIYIILADDSSCFFDVCVCVCVCVGGGGGGGGEGLKCHLPKNSPGALRVQAFIAVIMFTLVYRNTV